MIELNKVTETFHLAPRDEWEHQAKAASYAPEAFEREGFVHCTNGEANVVAVGNRYYRTDSRSFVCLVIGVGQVEAPISYEDEDRIYPHIYGRLNTSAVIRVREVRRDEHGVFLGLGD